MARDLYVAAPWWSGIKHRFVTLNHARSFVMYENFRLHFIWGVSEGVGYCRFDELLSPIPGVHVVNVSEPELQDIETSYRSRSAISFHGKRLHTHRPGDHVPDQAIVFDLWGDFAETISIEDQVPVHLRPLDRLIAVPAVELQQKSDAFIRRHNVRSRIGIRVRVTENPKDGRTLRRIQRDMDKAIKSLVALPWYVRVFVATDSEYIQQMLCSHFLDAKYLAKNFSDRAAVGRYIDRRDPVAMRTFLMEVACLTSCRKIVNMGGFINEESLAHKIIEPPWKSEVFGLMKAVAS